MKKLSENMYWHHPGRGLALVAKKHGIGDYRIYYYAEGRRRGEVRCTDNASWKYFVALWHSALEHLAKTLYQSKIRIRVPNRQERRAMKKAGVL